MPLPCVLTVDEAADVLKVSTKTIYRLLRDGDLPYVAVRGSYRITLAALEKYIEAGGKQLE
ncbi:MAG: helix-turn-helix domain-containing protein [Oscillospiraceae bacterium]